MKKTIFILLAFALSIMACKKERHQAPPVNIFGFDNYEEAANNLGVYVHIFDLVEGALVMRKTESMGSGFKSYMLGAFFRDDISSENSVGGTYYINETTLEHNGNYYSLNGMEEMSMEDKEAVIEPLFGQTNNFRLEREGNDIFNTDYYLPEAIKVSNLTVSEFHVEVNPSEGLYVEWNADPDNTNGVVFYLGYTGFNFDEHSVTGEIDRAVKVEDTGSTTLSPDFFEGLPDNASFTVWCIRGNAITIEAGDNRRYSVYSITEHKLPCLTI